MRVDRLQPSRHGPHHFGKRGIADLLDAVGMRYFNRNPVRPQSRRPEKIVNRHHHLEFIPTVMIILAGAPETGPWSLY
jgi:hypothetical protein